MMVGRSRALPRDAHLRLAPNVLEIGPSGYRTGMRRLGPVAITPARSPGPRRVRPPPHRRSPTRRHRRAGRRPSTPSPPSRPLDLVFIDADKAPTDISRRPAKLAPGASSPRTTPVERASRRVDTSRTRWPSGRSTALPSIESRRGADHVRTASLIGSAGRTCRLPLHLCPASRRRGDRGAGDGVLHGRSRRRDEIASPSTCSLHQAKDLLGGFWTIFPVSAATGDGGYWTTRRVDLDATSKWSRVKARDCRWSSPRGRLLPGRMTRCSRSPAILRCPAGFVHWLGPGGSTC